MESVAAAAVHPPRDDVATFPWYLAALLAGSTSIAIGVLWDLSWHLTVGRDTFWSPPHVAVYLGGLLAGVSCGVLALRTTFAGTAEDRAGTVGLWGFRAPIGAWVAIWGAFAMLVSGPFDNWWHNAYGLDLDKFTPPHSLLLAGIIGIQFGAMLIALALQNRAAAGGLRRLGIAHLFAAGIAMEMLIPLHIMDPNRQHGGSFYRLMSAFLPFLLVAVARSSRLRWAATITSGFYMLIVASMVWILPLFPGQPRLGPIITQLDHMVAPFFPLVLVVPALGIDAVMQRRDTKRSGWLVAIAAGAAFFVLFLATHWYFSEFMLSPASRNWFFGANRYLSYSAPELGAIQYEFWGQEADPMTKTSFAISLVLSIVSARLGLWWGQWMARVQR